VKLQKLKKKKNRDRQTIYELGVKNLFLIVYEVTWMIFATSSYQQKKDKFHSLGI